MKETAESKIEQSAANLVACTRSIENFPIAASDIYSNPKLGYITAQVAKFIEDWANF